MQRCARPIVKIERRRDVRTIRHNEKPNLITPREIRLHLGFLSFNDLLYVGYRPADEARFHFGPDAISSVLEPTYADAM